MTEPKPIGRTVQLSSGFVTISCAADLFSMSKADRDFILGLVEMVENYAAKGLKED